MMVSMGPILLNGVPPHPDQTDSSSMLDGVMKRIGKAHDRPDRLRLVRLKTFARKWLEKHCKPLSPDSDLSFHTWVKERPYPLARKNELTKIYEGMCTMYSTLPKRFRKVKCFMKDETYPTFKYPRGIFSKCDEFKVLFGPICSAIEADMYLNKEFIKHIPVPDRPRYIEDYLSAFVKSSAATDYTSYESSFTKEVMESLDQVMFEYYLEHLGNPRSNELYQSLLQTNNCTFKWFTVALEAKRLSGEMNTSLSNGFANLMVMKFLCEEYDCGDLRMVVEGDDGLAITSSGRFPPYGAFSSLGFTVKLELHSSKTTASFCGIIYDPLDCINVTEPLTVLAEFGWATQRYAKCRNSRLLTLMRCKSFSMLYQYPGCPIIQEMALYGLRITRSYDVRRFISHDVAMNAWERETLLKAIKYKQDFVPVPEATRLLVESKFGISIEQQLEIEELFSKKNDLSPFAINADVPKEWTIYMNHYVMPMDPVNTTLLYGRRIDPFTFTYKDVRVTKTRY